MVVAWVMLQRLRSEKEFLTLFHVSKPRETNFRNTNPATNEGDEPVDHVYPVLPVQRASLPLLPQTLHHPSQLSTTLLARLWGAIIAQKLDPATGIFLRKVDLEASIAIWWRVHLISAISRSTWCNLNQLAVQEHALSMRPLRLEQRASHRKVDQPERAGSLAETNDPVLEAFVHHPELDFDRPCVVAVEDSEGFSTDLARDGSQRVLDLVEGGRNAVEQGLLKHKLLAVAVDLGPDLEWKTEEGYRIVALVGLGRINALDMDRLLWWAPVALLVGVPVGLQCRLVVEVGTVEAVVARVRW